MSYILDALKKADADRERDAAAVPDLHAQADAMRGALAARRPSRGLLLAAVAGAVVLAVLAWRWLDAPQADAAPGVPLAQAPAEALAPSTPAPAPVAPMSPPPPPPDAAVPAAAPLVAPEPAPIPSLASKPAPPQRLPAREAAAAPAAAAARASPPASAAAGSRVYGMAELPADIRSQLPALVVGGSVYSPKSSGRIVILNGQVFREGDKPIEGLIVEGIGLKSTVLAFRGTRFELKH